MSSFPPLTGPIVPLTGIPGSPPDLAKPPLGLPLPPALPAVHRRRQPACTALQISERPVLREIEPGHQRRLSLGGGAMSTLEVQRLGKRFPVRGAAL